MPPVFVAAKIAKLINFECGCMAEYVILGNFASTKEWHIQPCSKHYLLVDRLKRDLERDVLAVVREVVSEQEAVALLNEKGYICQTP